MPTGKPALLKEVAAMLSAVIDPSAAMFCSSDSSDCRQRIEPCAVRRQAAAGHQLHCVVAQPTRLTVLPWLCRKSMTWVAR